MNRDDLTLPFLRSLLWQTNGQIEGLSSEEMLAIYERGWRYRHTLVSPSPAELDFIRALAIQHHSWLIQDV